MPKSARLPDHLLDAAIAAADLAGRLIRPHFRTGLAADTKRDDSPVTIADRDAERAMRALLSERIPEAGILGEEGGLDRPDARLRWVLDPIDGTRAFLTGRPSFGVLIALLDDGVPMLGLIDQPVTASAGSAWPAGRPASPARSAAPPARGAAPR